MLGACRQPRPHEVSAVPDRYLMAMTTTDAREHADRLARSLVEERLAACVQVLGPITSTYRWQGQVETAEEWLCLIKTTAHRFGALAAHVDANHGYDTPELTAVPISDGSPRYLAWVSGETGGA
jgi:periplasmic divalent cation tolerance protein